MKKSKKTKEPSPFELYTNALSNEEAGKLAAFFHDVEDHCSLPRKEKEGLRADFENALMRYFESGIALDEALRRLDVKNLGGFYARPPILWYALDDAAKIYPLSMKHGQMAVFRLSVYLKGKIVPELLQMALAFTIKRFPSFATTVKKGFFWHYLDTTKRRFVTENDTGLPCRPLRIAHSGSQSFRVMYYENRISVEFFHILTDGTGGMIFLKTLTAEYLKLMGAEFSYGDGVLDINEVPSEEETANEFERAERSDKSSGFIDKPALQMSGKLSKAKPYRVLHFKMNASELKSAAKGQGATVTSYILAQMFLSGRYATDEQDGEMNIQVPVNMRKFHPSATVRNFAMYCGIRLPVKRITTVNQIASEISDQLSDKTCGQAMGEMMSATQSMVSAVRFVPLFIKAPVARVVYGFLGDRIFSNTLSNLGVVKMPEQIAGCIESMDFALGTALTNRAGCALVTYGNISTLSISKMTSDPSFEERLYELLCGDGIDVSVEGSEPYES